MGTQKKTCHIKIFNIIWVTKTLIFLSVTDANQAKVVFLVKWAEILLNANHDCLTIYNIMPLVTLYLLKRLSEEEYQMTNFVRY